MIFLASPYRDPDPQVRVRRYKRAVEFCAAHLLSDIKRRPIYSPIVHWHPVAEADPHLHDKDTAFWMAQNRPMLEICDELWVLALQRISVNPIAVDKNANIRVIAGNGRVLMPGLIDAHWHAFMAATPLALLTTADPSYLHLLAARQAEATLMRGFTTIRDLGGPVFGLKRAIDEGVAVGPRIYPSGALISQTSGHGDARFLFEIPRTKGGPLSQSEVMGAAAIADSPDEVRLRTREQLRLGASQIKLMAGGGTSCHHLTIRSNQLSTRKRSFVPRLRRPKIGAPM